MPPRKPVPSRRYHVTFDPADADVLEEQARRVGRAPSTLIAILAREGIERIRIGASDEAAELRRQLGQAEGERDRLRARLHQLQEQLLRRPRAGGQAGEEGDEEPELPRYARPIEQLLADGEWWDKLLPLLYELLGRSSLDSSLGGPVIDQRGYNDLLTYLFPAVEGDSGGITWRSPAYPEHQPDAWTAAMWEPVLRHVARALCALESTLQRGADPFTTIRIMDEISGGPWLATLRHITGEERPPALVKYQGPQLARQAKQ